MHVLKCNSEKHTDKDIFGESGYRSRQLRSIPAREAGALSLKLYSDALTTFSSNAAENKKDDLNTPIISTNLKQLADIPSLYNRRLQDIAVLWNIGQKWPKASEKQSFPFGPFIKSLREAVDLGQMALKQVCTNFFRSTPA